MPPPCCTEPAACLPPPSPHAQLLLVLKSINKLQVQCAWGLENGDHISGRPSKHSMQQSALHGAPQRLLPLSFTSTKQAAVQVATSPDSAATWRPPNPM